MKRISLIANSSIQYHKFETKIDQEFGKNNRIVYHEPFDMATVNYVFDPLLKYSKDGQDFVFKKEELIDKSAIVYGKIKEGTEPSEFKNILDFFEENNLKNALKHFQKVWIPLPYFKDNSINRDILYPTDWVRVFIDCDENFTEAKIIIAVDTSLAKSDDDKTSPKLSLNLEENIYKIHSDELNLSRFLSSKDSTTAWIDKYLGDVYFGKYEEKRFEKPIKKYVASYVLLIKWLSTLMDMPDIQLFTSDVRKKSVDMVVDIGNSSTCALLFESKNVNTFEFENVKKLIIQDYTNPHLEYDRPFPMNLVFSESKFGELNSEIYHNNKFIVPSFVRVGYEAENMINNSITDLSLGYELKTYNSSPKRYLWDKEIAEREWEFNPKEKGKVKKVYLNGISEQVRADGALVKGNELFGTKALFSKSSLMKFVFLEMLIHAYVQINSFKFREEHGDMMVPRTLERITISCPTGMPQNEQIELRKAAEEACAMLNNYVKYYFEDDSEKFWFTVPQIIPSIQDISKKLSESAEKVDWTYDEATVGQFVFMYSLLAKKLKNEDYVLDHYLFKNKNKLTVASVDIGAGTTDIMVNSYGLNSGDVLKILNPKPLFWDTFKIAGDDLVKEIIQKLIIEGTGDSENGFGSLRDFMTKNQIENPTEKLNGFFGEDSNKIGFRAKIMRKAFTHQVAIPVAMEFLNEANSGEEKVPKTIEEITGKPFKNNELVDYFEKYFGFSFLEFKWDISSKKVNEIIAAVFDSLIRQICVVFNQFQCDYVILSGKPASLISLEDIFRKYLSVAPKNLINLNSYWIGRWYPFADNNGFIEDPKTIVGVGSIIALMAGKLNKIGDMKIATSELAQKLVSTADFIVENEGATKKVLLTPKKNDQVISVPKLPYIFGYSKYLSSNYPFSNLYSMQINDKEVEQVVRKRYPGRDETYIQNQINVEKSSIFQNLPLKITLSRDFDESKEELFIENIEDAEGNDKSTKYISLNFQTLKNANGYWLDTCEFTLSV